MSKKIIATLLACTALTAAAPAAWAARPELHVTESITLDASPAQVWQIIGQFNDLSWHPVVANTTITHGQPQTQGAIRQIETKDGAKLDEELLSLDTRQHRMRYRILNSPLPVANYVSTLSVHAAGKGSRVVWASRFQRKDEHPAPGGDDASAKKTVSGIYSAGFTALQSKLSGQ